MNGASTGRHSDESDDRLADYFILLPRAVGSQVFDGPRLETAELAQIFERVDAAAVAVRPRQAHRVVADLLDVAQLEHQARRRLHRVDPANAVVVALALGARAQAAQDAMGMEIGRASCRERV